MFEIKHKPPYLIDADTLGKTWVYQRLKKISDESSHL